MPIKKILFVLVSLILLLGGYWFYRSTFGRPSADFYVSGDPIDIELVGIRPNSGDEVYGLDGELLKKVNFGANYRLKWDPNHHDREFFFETAPEVEPIFVYKTSLTVLDGETVARGGFLNTSGRLSHHHSAKIEYDEKTPYEFSPLKRFPILDRFVRFKWWIPSTRADITLRFFRKEIGPAELNFEGPFQTGEPVAARENTRIKITLGTDFLTTRSVPFAAEIDAPTDFTYHTRTWILYDKEGNRHLPATAGESIHSKPVLHWWVRLSPKQIQCITVNEEPFEKTFHNVPIDFPHWDDRNVSPYWEAFATAIGREDVETFRPGDFRFESIDHVLELRKHLRGSLIHPSHQILMHSESRKEWAADHPGKSDQVKRLALEWLNASDNDAQRLGLEVGLSWKFPEFIDPALDWIESDRLNDPQRFEPRRVLVRADLFTEEQFLRVANFLLDPRTESIARQASEYIRALSTPAAQGARERLIREGEVWLWWPILRQDLFGQDQTVPIEERTTWLAEEILKRKRSVGNKLTEDSRSLDSRLAELIAPRMIALNCLGTFSEIYDAFVDSTTPERGTPILVGILEEMVEEWDSFYYPRGYSNSQYAYATRRMVESLNEWNNLNLGQLSDSPTAVSEDRNWKAIAEEAIAWGKTREDPSLLPAGWEPTPHDLRIVFKNLVYPELSSIGIWEASPSDPAVNPTLHQELAMEYFQCRPRVIGKSGEKRIHLGMNYGVRMRNSSSRNHEYTFEELPQKIPIDHYTGSVGGSPDGRTVRGTTWIGEWEVWLEPANAQESALSGSRLYEAWRDDLSSEEKVPRVYQKHSETELVEYIQDRRDTEDWSEAEIALRRTMDQDPGYLTEDLQGLLDDIPLHQTIEAWARFLEREDLTLEMKIFAWSRLGFLHRGERGSERNDASLAMADAAFTQAIELDPTLVTDELMRARSWRIGTNPDREVMAHRYLAFLEWLDSLTEDQLRESATRPWMQRNGRPTRLLAAGSAPLEREVRGLRKGIENYRETTAKNLEWHLKSLERQNPDLVKKLQKNSRR